MEDAESTTLLYQDLKVLFRFVPKSFMTVLLTVVGCALVKSSNDIRDYQIAYCAGHRYVTGLKKHDPEKCFINWMKYVNQCNKPVALPLLYYSNIVGRFVSYYVSGKPDIGSPKAIMFRCFAMKACITFIFSLYVYIPPGIVYLYDFSLGYIEGSLFCSAQSLMSRWTTKHLTVFSSLIQSTFYLSRAEIAPIVIYVIVAMTGAENNSQVQIYISLMIGVFCLFWNFLIFDSPKTHRFIMENDAKKILKSSDYALYEVNKIPWKKIWGNKYFLLYLVVRSAAKFQYLFFRRVSVTIFCSSEGEFEELFSRHIAASLCGALLPSFLTDIVTSTGFFTKAGARKTLFFLFVVGNVSYFHYYLCTVEYKDNVLYTHHKGYFFFAVFMNSFYFSAIACQHFDLSPTFASSQAAVVFLFGEIVHLLDWVFYDMVMTMTNTFMSKYMLLYWMAIVVVMVPLMMLNTCFNNFNIQDFNKCTRDICKKEVEVYPINISGYH